jgi:ribosomal protein S18 acetylase RimI-like enzyme
MRAPALPGQATLVASWRALACTSPGAAVTESPGSVAACFPAWVPLNNAIALVPVADEERTTLEVARLDASYRDAGVATWAYWVPSPARDLVATDAVVVAGLTRDVTTLVMRSDLDHERPSTADVRATSLASAASAGDAPIAVEVLGDAEGAPGVDAWVMIDGAAAVAGVWTVLHEHDCGVYAMGTAPGWRRRGLARALLEHALADAWRRGARTASLQSTPEAVSLYRSLGFEAVGRYEEWVCDSRGSIS